MDSIQIQLNIPLHFRQIVEIVRQLSPDEKKELSEILLREAGSDDLVVPEEHKQIVRDRMNEYKMHPDNYLSWDDIELKIKRRK